MGFGIALIVLLLGGPLVGVIVLAVIQNKQSQRIESLERQVADLRSAKTHETSIAQVKVQQPVVDKVEVVQPSVSEAVLQEKVVINKPQAEKKELPKWLKNLFTVESIISKLGILMLLIGVGYIFKMAYDNGYITEELAVLSGVLIGGVLMYLGFVISRKGRDVLCQVLWGGGIAVFYISTFAAYQGYGLIHGVLAFIFMCVVTAAGFVLALITDSIAMSIIAILGGLLTPFVLQLNQLGLFGTGTYIFVIAVFAMGVYVFKKWRVLQLASILGSYIVTTYFISLDSMTVIEKGQLAVLMLLLMLLFVGVEYILAFAGMLSSKFKVITYSVVAVLPMVTTLQVWVTLEVSDRTWAIIFVIVAFVYLLVSYIFIRAQKSKVLENISIGLLASFLLFAVAIELGGDIRPIALIVLGIIYYTFADKLKSLAARWIGHVLFGIGYCLAFYRLMDAIAIYGLFDSKPGAIMTFGPFIYRLITGALFLIGIYMNKDKVKEVLGTLGIQLYLLPVMMFQVHGLLRGIEPNYRHGIQVLVYGGLIGIVWTVNHWKHSMPKWSFIGLVSLPLLYKCLSSIDIMINDTNRFSPIVVGAYVVFSAMIYALMQLKHLEIERWIRVILKVILYGVIFVILLMDVAVMVDNFGLSLVVLSGVLFGMQFLESDRDDVVIEKFRFASKIVWFVMVLIYALVSFGRFDFEWQILIVDAGLLVMVFLQMRYFERVIKKHYIAAIIGLLYMALFYSNLSTTEEGRGIVTLGWAGFAVGILAYSVKKAEKKMIHLSMGFIVIVAAKIVLIDLASVTTIWKIIVSMAFGTALLVLSYLLQPILKDQKLE